jgi:hypothetical protein
MTISTEYALYVDTDRCALYSYDAFQEMDFNEYTIQTFTGKPLPASWRLPKHAIEYGWFALNDFVLGFAEAPFVSQRAKAALEPVLGKEAEFRAIGRILNEDYYIMNVTNLVDCLDESNSKIVYSDDDGRVLSVRQAVFLRRRMGDVSLFKVPQDMGRIYATDRLVEVVRKIKLTGVGFELSNNVGVGVINNAFSDLPLHSNSARQP